MTGPCPLFKKIIEMLLPSLPLLANNVLAKCGPTHVNSGITEDVDLVGMRVTVFCGVRWGGCRWRDHSYSTYKRTCWATPPRIQRGRKCDKNSWIIQLNQQLKSACGNRKVQFTATLSTVCFVKAQLLFL